MDEGLSATKGGRPPGIAASARGSKVFYGWWVVLAAAIAMFINTGIGFYSVSLFFTPLEAEFHWSRASISGAMSISFMGMAILGPAVGWWSDRYGVRSLMSCGAAVMGLGLALLYFMTSQWQLFAIFAVIATGRAMLSTVPVSTAIANWFIEKRGTALGLTMAGFGIGGLIMVPISGMLISAWGWRAALVTLAIITWVTAIPPIMLIVRTRPSDIGLRPYGEAKAKDKPDSAAKPSANRMVDEYRAWTIPQLFRTSTFWYIVTAMAFVFFAQAAILVHTVPLLVDRGLSLTVASFALSVTAGMGTVGKISLGALADRIPAKYVLALCAGLQFVGLLILMLAGSSGTVWLYAVVFGVGMGATVAVQPVLVSQCFGIGSFGLAFGTEQLFVTTFNSLGPLCAGWLYDSTGSYAVGMTIFGGCYLAGTALVLLVRKPRESRQVAPAAVQA